MPPPQMLAAYEKARQGLADRIVAMAEREQGQRHHCERVATENDTARSRDGQRFGFAIAVLFLAVSAILILAGHGAEGTIIASVDIIGLAAVFVTGRLTKRSERIEKARRLAELARDADEDDEDYVLVSRSSVPYLAARVHPCEAAVRRGLAG
jgi:uncharacterized membrane protein